MDVTRYIRYIITGVSGYDTITGEKNNNPPKEGRKHSNPFSYDVEMCVAGVAACRFRNSSVEYKLTDRK